MKSKQSPKNMKLLLLLIPLLGALAVSGCTGSSSGITTGPGVQIVSWTAQPPTLDSGDQLELRLQIQNKGDVPAQDVRAFITGIIPENWHLVPPNNYGGGSLTTGQILFTNELLGPDKSQNIDSSPLDVTVEAMAPPDVLRGTTQPFTPQVRVYYTYETSASNQLTIVNDNELKRLQDNGKTLSSGTTVQSAGPLSVTINTGKFLKAKTNSPVSRQFQITTVVQNTGGGVVSPNSDNPLSISGSQDYKVLFKIWSSSNRLTLDCPSLSSDTSFIVHEYQYDKEDNQYTIPSSNKNGMIKLFGGKSASVTCTVTINSPPISTEQSEIKVLLVYDYYIDSSTTVTVNGV